MEREDGGQQREIENNRERYRKESARKRDRWRVRLILSLCVSEGADA